MSTKNKFILLTIFAIFAITSLPAASIEVVIPHEQLVDLELADQSIISDEEIKDFSFLNPGSISTINGKKSYRILLSNDGPIRSVLLMSGVMINAKSSGGEGGGY